MEGTRKDLVVSAICGEGVIRVSNIKYSIYCCCMLTTLAILDVTDRWALPTLQISGLQCSSCNGVDSSVTEKCLSECLDITDSQMGFLLGPAFSLTSIAASLPIAYLADHYKRVHILLSGMILWSFVTLLSSFSQTFHQLVFLRMLLGIGAAVVNPTAFSLLSDYFGPKYRSTVMAAFQSTVYIGQDFGLFCGILSQETSWRLVFFLLGLPGLLMAIPFYLTVWEPIRGLSEPTQNFSFSESRSSDIELQDTISSNSSIKNRIAQSSDKLDESKSMENDSTTEIREIMVGVEEAEDYTVQSNIVPIKTAIMYDDQTDYSPYTSIQKVKYILSMRCFQIMWISAAFRFMAGFGLASWIQVFYRRVFGLSPTAIALRMALIVTFGGIPSIYLGGIISDAWKKRMAHGGAALLSLCSFFSVPFILGTLFCGSYQLSFLLLFGEYFFAEMWLGPAITVIQDIMPPCIRTVASSVYFVSLAVGAMSPFVIGWLIDYFAIEAPFQDSNENISYDPTYPIAIVVAGSYFMSACGFTYVCYLLQTRTKGK